MRVWINNSLKLRSWLPAFYAKPRSWLLAPSQLTKSLFNSFDVVFALRATENNEVSPANNFAFDKRLSARSFIYIKNRNGPSMEPWGTPALTSTQVEVCLLRTTLCFLFLKKFVYRFKRLPDMPFSFSLKIRPSCHTLSKALDTSWNILRTSKPSSNDW